MIDAKVTKLCETTDKTVDDIAREMRHVPVLDGMVELIKRVKDHGATITIVSGECGISVILLVKKGGKSECVTFVDANDL